MITRVHKLIDKAVWTARYERICELEKGLTESGTTIAKFFLHISKDEQLSRFGERLEEPIARVKPRTGKNLTNFTAKKSA